MRSPCTRFRSRRDDAAESLVPAKMLAMPWCCVSFSFVCMWLGCLLLAQLFPLLTDLIERRGRRARILRNPDFDHRWQSGFQRALERRHELRGGFDKLDMGAER